MQVSFMAFIRGGLPVEVTANITPGRPASYYDPGYDAEVEIEEVRWLSRVRKDGHRRTGSLVPQHIVDAITSDEIDTINERAFDAAY